MHCSKAQGHLQLYIDGRLTLQQVRMLEAHIATCPACQHELHMLEEVSSAVRNMQFVAEPPDLTAQIMQRVSLHRLRERQRKQWLHDLFRPSVWELLIAVVLASITTLGLILGQPNLRAALPFLNWPLPLIANITHMLLTSENGMLMWLLWIGGTALGICITLALAGNELRSDWYKAMMARLPGDGARRLPVR